METIIVLAILLSLWLWLRRRKRARAAAAGEALGGLLRGVSRHRDDSRGGTL